MVPGSRTPLQDRPRSVLFEDVITVILGCLQYRQLCFFLGSSAYLPYSVQLLNDIFLITI